MLLLFGQTAKQWKNNNPGKKGNVRDDANLNQLLAALADRWLEFIRVMHRKQIHEEMLISVAEAISKLVSNPKFSDLIRSKINMEVDTSALDQEIANYEKQLRQLYHNKETILSDIDSLDYEDKHYQQRKTDL